MLGLDQQMDVYTEGGTGAFDTPAQTAVACRLCHVRGGQTAADRAELAALRLLLWSADYEMPEDTVQVQIDGTRWNPVPGTYAAMRGPTRQVVYRQAQVVRVV